MFIIATPFDDLDITIQLLSIEKQYYKTKYNKIQKRSLYIIGYDKLKIQKYLIEKTNEFYFKHYDVIYFRDRYEINLYIEVGIKFTFA
jgi:hypothetical protein